MLFNSFDFAVFLPIVFFLYWCIRSSHWRIQNALIVLASYIFYGWWDKRFLILIIFSTILDFAIGWRLGKENDKEKRKYLLWISIGANLGLLFFFKYFNFFLDNFITAFSFLGIQWNTQSLSIILPVGISFYTFQTLSYTIDVYRRKLTPTRDLLAFAAFVSFFPQLVAGPIERATHLLPQFKAPRSFDYDKAVDGMKQILWGLFKKMVIADNCAEYANLIFDHSDEYSGVILALGAFFFAFQIYGDFSGYSDIAIGTSRLFGFDLRQNFAFPYFSRNIAEFWRRWHISLSSWFVDYIYIPLGGSRGSMGMVVRNTFIIFLLSGFWHGANWTFIAWGALNALYFLPLLLLKANRNHLDIVAAGRYLPTLKEFFQMMTTFLLTLFAWIFFRAESIEHALNYILNMMTQAPFAHAELLAEDTLKVVLILITVFLAIEWVGRDGRYALENIDSNQSYFFKIIFYSFIIFSIGMYAQTNETPFLYFQF